MAGIPAVFKLCASNQYNVEKLRIALVPVVQRLGRLPNHPGYFGQAVEPGLFGGF